MELLQLTYFKEVAECGKISTAAEKLYISAPSLSATIKRLEKELGTPLFARSGNSIELNEQGRIFLRYVNQALSSLESGKEELKNYSEAARHHVRIAATTSNLWVGLLSAFSLEYPQITISNTSLKLNQLPEGSLYPQYNFLLAEKNDFLRESSRKNQGEAMAEEIPSAFSGRVLIEKDRPVLVVPHDHRLAGEKDIDLRMLKNENFLLPVAGMSLHRMTLELLEKAGASKANLSECSYMLRRQMISEHRGIAFSTEYTSRSEDPSMCYIPISYPDMPQKHLICWDKKRTLTEDEQAFLDFAAEYFSSGLG